MKLLLILSMIRFISLVFLNWSMILLRVSADSFLFPLTSFSSHLLNISWMMLKLDGSFSLISKPNFFRSLAMDYFLKSKEQLSAKNSKIPLFSMKSPSALFFLDVEELKHFNWISLTSIFDSFWMIDLVFFSMSYLCLSTSFWISCFLLSISHSMRPVLYFWWWIWFLCFSSSVLVLNYFYLSSTTRWSYLSLAT